MTDKEKIVRALQKLEFNVRSTAQYTKTDDSYLAVMHIATAIGDTVDEIRKDFPENRTSNRENNTLSNRGVTSSIFS